ncbi:lymphocyte antigen 96 isoform X2 [Anser cygnoides]|uniref:lymphocyte antigen 96 isoform X2 n=1 Tax=Anser cygnoides TaxID=8845 RepID=UPI0034D23732
MFGLVFFILFTPGVSGFFCTSSDLEMSYTFCDSTAHDFMFNVTPCTMLNASIWHAALTWVPKSDIAFLKVVFTVWYDGAKALHWKETVCSGADDEYYVCEMLKGETITTTFDIKGKRTVFPKTLQINPGHRGCFCKQLESNLGNMKHSNFPEVEHIMFCVESYEMESLNHS